MAARKKSAADEQVFIKSPNFRIMHIPIRGNANYVSNAFSEEARNMMAADMAKGSVDKPRGSRNKPPKDFDAGYRGSLHRSTEGWFGIPCVAIRAAMVRAASLAQIEMTRAKMCIFIMPDGFDSSGQGLVRIIKGEPERFDAYVRNSNGTADIRSRARFPPGWEAIIPIRYDADFLSGDSAINLLARAGVSVGVGAGRPFSQMSVGQGWGTFDIYMREEEKEAAE